MATNAPKHAHATPKHVHACLYYNYHLYIHFFEMELQRKRVI